MEKEKAHCSGIDFIDYDANELPATGIVKTHLLKYILHFNL